MKGARGYLTRTARHCSRRRLAAASQVEEVDPGIVAGLQIVKYPHPALRAANVEVRESEFETAEKLARRMLDLMYEAKGVGLAAPQVGVNKRLMVFNPEGKRERWLDEVVFLNPKIVDSSKGRDSEPEGCLSFPDMQGNVDRAKWIKVEGLSPKGRKIKKKYTGWVARIFQHEFDHLDGIVYVDRLNDQDRGAIQPKLDDLVQNHDGAKHGPPAL
ncbi:hypothetical protein CTAYLR_004079 [Chrysophaeum taylorii]|uniref:Peptide deformylase n=1 Tax=Chrysophaeum taylorii TaxID=2483200 RepID=A0AAD7XSC3_9STRA|nr:hypothetical protein CTAYLR_004079 [Chrysophaeum taylorii]